MIPGCRAALVAAPFQEKPNEAARWAARAARQKPFRIGHGDARSAPPTRYGFGPGCPPRKFLRPMIGFVRRIAR
jgi:hypothetical protein